MGFCFVSSKLRLAESKRHPQAVSPLVGEMAGRPEGVFASADHKHLGENHP
jgi:hypothetical protein